jgi:hypothetical protein
MPPAPDDPQPPDRSATGGARRAEIRLADAEPVDVTAITDPPRRAWPIMRRVLAESRDRASPLLKH